MNKYEAYRTGRFERLEFVGAAEGVRSGRLWLQGTITYRPHPESLPLTEDFQLEIIPPLSTVTPSFHS